MSFDMLTKQPKDQLELNQYMYDQTLQTPVPPIATVNV